MFSIFVPSGHPYFRGSLSAAATTAVLLILTRRLTRILAALTRVLTFRTAELDECIRSFHICGGWGRTTLRHIPNSSTGHSIQRIKIYRRRRRLVLFLRVVLRVLRALRLFLR